MKIKFNNEILKGEIIIDRPLTVFTGRNGTGKTYAADAIKKNAMKNRLLPTEKLYESQRRDGTYLSYDIAAIACEMELKIFGINIRTRHYCDFYEKEGKELFTGGHNIPDSLKEFTKIILRLKYGTKDDGVLILDCPETRQDAENIIQIARFITRLANAGLRIILITNDHYLKNQLSNLVLLGILPDSEAKDNFMKEFSLTYDMALAHTNARHYDFANGEVKQVAVDADGFNFKDYEVPEKLYDERISLFGLWNENKGI